MQVDVDRAAGVVSSLHNLWSLPLQIVVAFALLYWQVKLAFLAGVVLILILLPLNTAVANRIGVATKDLMTRKDLRMKLISEALGSMTGMKRVLLPRY